MFFPCFSHETLGTFYVFPHFHLPVVQPSPNLPRPVPAGCIAWQWPCWMKPKRISPQWWVYGEIHHVKIWVKIHEKKVINMMKYGEHLKNLDHHVSCLESHAGEMCFFGVEDQESLFQLDYRGQTPGTSELFWSWWGGMPVG